MQVLSLLLIWTQGPQRCNQDKATRVSLHPIWLASLYKGNLDTAEPEHHAKTETHAHQWPREDTGSHTHTKGRWYMKMEDGYVAKLRNVCRHQTLEEARKALPSRFHGEHDPIDTLILGFSASSNVREQISVVLKHPVCALLQKPQGRDRNSILMLRVALRKLKLKVTVSRR